MTPARSRRRRSRRTRATSGPHRLASTHRPRGAAARSARACGSPTSRAAGTPSTKISTASEIAGALACLKARLSFLFAAPFTGTRSGLGRQFDETHFFAKFWSGRWLRWFGRFDFFRRSRSLHDGLCRNFGWSGRGCFAYKWLSFGWRRLRRRLRRLGNNFDWGGGDSFRRGRWWFSFSDAAQFFFKKFGGDFVQRTRRDFGSYAQLPGFGQDFFVLDTEFFCNFVNTNGHNFFSANDSTRPSCD